MTIPMLIILVNFNSDPIRCLALGVVCSWRRPSSIRRSVIITIHMGFHMVIKIKRRGMIPTQNGASCTPFGHYKHTRMFHMVIKIKRRGMMITC